MNWTVEQIADKHFVKVVTWGGFTAADHRLMTADILSQKFWKPGINVLFDHRNLDFGVTNVPLMKEIGSTHIENDARIGSGKAAILMKSVPDFARGRQFEIITEGKISAKLQIFLDEKKALAWLLE
jgi:hypothetical protein